MSYTKHEFKSGDVLYASQLNEMDEQLEILANKPDFEQLQLDRTLSITDQAADAKAVGERFDTIVQMHSDPVYRNLFRASAPTVTGYTTPSGSINLETGEIPEDTPLVSTTLCKQIIPISPSTTYAISAGFVGRLTVFGEYGNRSIFIPNTDMTAGNNCLCFTTSATSYYLVVAYHDLSAVNSDSLMLMEGDTLPTYYISAEEATLSGLVLADEVQVRMQNVVGLTDALDSLKPVEPPAVPEEFDTLYALAERINAHQSGNTLTLSLMADTHYNTTDFNADTKLRTAQRMGMLGHYVKQDFIGNLGDVCSGKDPKAHTRKSMGILLESTVRNASAPVLLVRGNHDDNGWYSEEGNGGSRSPDEMLNDAEWNAFWFRFTSRAVGFVTDPAKPDGGYGYIDNEQSKIRVFVLNTEDIPYVCNSDGSYRYSSYGGACFSNDQINFVANALKFSDKTDRSAWAALFLSHRPVECSNDDGYRFGIRDALIRGYQCMLGVIDAYRKGSAYKFSGSTYNASLGDLSTDFQVNVNVDYEELGLGTVIGFLCGHTHTDNCSNHVGHENELSRGYTYLGMVGIDKFSTVLVDRAQSRITVVASAAGTPDTTGAVVDAPESGSIASGTYSVRFNQNYPTGEAITNGISSVWGDGYTIPASVSVNFDTMELKDATADEKYMLSKVIPVKHNTKYLVPNSFNGLIMALNANGGRSAYLTPALDSKGRKYIMTGNGQYYIVASLHVSYADRANFCIKECYSGLDAF